MATPRRCRKPRIICEETIYLEDSRDESESNRAAATLTSVYCSDCGLPNVCKQGLQKCTHCDAKFVAQTATASVLNQNHNNIRVNKATSTKSRDQNVQMRRKRTPEGVPSANESIKVACSFRPLTDAEKKAMSTVMGKYCIEIEGKMYIYDKVVEPLNEDLTKATKYKQITEDSEEVEKLKAELKDKEELIEIFRRDYQRLFIQRNDVRAEVQDFIKNISSKLGL